jgi:TatD DNase family protein
MLIDIHTHKPHQNDVWSIQNIHELFNSINTLFQYSFGIHPWHIDESTFKVSFEILKKESIKKNILAIGETGLDRLCNTPFKIQEQVFIQHILWANEIAKPLIIHCVRAYREVLFLLKEYNNHMPVIFHGFNNNEEIANLIIQNGHYLSFGKSLMNPSMEKVFSKISLKHIFLETDDSHVSIETIYQQAAKIKQIPRDQLRLQIFKNTQKVFNIVSL